MRCLRGGSIIVSKDWIPGEVIMDSNGRSAPARSKLEQILTRCAMSLDCATALDPSGARVTLVLRQQISANLVRSDLLETALKLGVPTRTLQRRLAQLGTTFAAELAAIRLSEAQERLTETDMSVVTIARGLGFSSAQSFARQFKRLTGQTPSEWRSRRLSAQQPVDGYGLTELPHPMERLTFRAVRPWCTSQSRCLLLPSLISVETLNNQPTSRSRVGCSWVRGTQDFGRRFSSPRGRWVLA